MTPLRLLLVLPWLAVCVAQAQPSNADAACGEVRELRTRDGSSTRYAHRPPDKPATEGAPITLVLLAGGSGHVDLDTNGCARALKGNSLVRSIALFGAAGLGTALVDAPSDHQGDDGLGGFRNTEPHAQDIGQVITDLRERTHGAVWLVGTSRGTISAANAAARLNGAAAPDGVVLTSPVTSGQPGAKKSWVAQTVFDVPLEAIRQPLLVLGHAADTCVRSPASLMYGIVARTEGRREQAVTVTGGASMPRPGGTAACEGRSPHGFMGQEAEVAAGMARFIRGGSF